MSNEIYTGNVNETNKYSRIARVQDVCKTAHKLYKFDWSFISNSKLHV